MTSEQQESMPVGKQPEVKKARGRAANAGITAVVAMAAYAVMARNTFGEDLTTPVIAPATIYLSGLIALFVALGRFVPAFFPSGRSRLAADWMAVLFVAIASGIIVVVFHDYVSWVTAVLALATFAGPIAQDMIED